MCVCVCMCVCLLLTTPPKYETYYVAPWIWHGSIFLLTNTPGKVVLNGKLTWIVIMLGVAYMMSHIVYTTHVVCTPTWCVKYRLDSAVSLTPPLQSKTSGVK